MRPAAEAEAMLRDEIADALSELKALNITSAAHVQHAGNDEAVIN